MLVDTTGRPLHGPEVKSISRQKLKRFEEFQQIVNECGWTLVCRKCANFVAGDNDPTGDRLSVKCSCREWVWSAHN